MLAHTEILCNAPGTLGQQTRALVRIAVATVRSASSKGLTMSTAAPPGGGGNNHPVQWELVLAEGSTKMWGWRRLAADGTIEEQSSETLPDFGRAMSSALAHGFKPKEHSWVIRNATWTTHFPPGDNPVNVTRTD